MRYPAVLAAIFLAACLGCDNQNHKRIVSLPAEIVISKPVFATQRFIPTNSAEVAFDTKTGSLCKTWNWSDPKGTEYGAGIGSQATTCGQLYENDQADEMRKTAALERANEPRTPKGQ